MNDKPLQILLRSELLKGFARYGVEGLPVIVGYPPVTTGKRQRACYFFKVSKAARGWQQRSRTTDPATLQLTTQELQFWESLFQVQIFNPEDVNDMTQQTAEDLTEIARMIVQSQPFIKAMTAAGVGVQQPSSIRSPFFENEHGQFEANPSFDFTVSHKRVIIQSTDSIDKMELNIRRV